MTKKILIVGGGAREHVLGETVARYGGKIWVAMFNRNPGLWELSGKGERVLSVKDTQIDTIARWAEKTGIELAFIGPEAGLGAGIIDVLKSCEIPGVGPNQTAAQLEVDKRFMRTLLDKYQIPCQLDYRVCNNAIQVKEFLHDLSDRGIEGVVKPVGLTGGKGVKVMGDQLESIDDAVHYAHEILNTRMSGFAQVIIEERAVGEEFTLQAFCDGKNVAPMPAAQDHPHALEGDVGAITGGMGSYTQTDGLLPFLSQKDYDEALDCIRQTVRAMADEGRPYHGFLYGQFVCTVRGPKLVEFNARYGDPEAMNVLPLLDYDFIELGYRIAEGKLPTEVPFKPMASVCKYVVPKGYGTKPEAPAPLEVKMGALKKAGAELYYAAVNLEENGQIMTMTSRSCGIVGIGPSIEIAEQICEAGLRNVRGNHLYVRHDIATQASLAKRVTHMEMLRAEALG